MYLHRSPRRVTGPLRGVAVIAVAIVGTQAYGASAPAPESPVAR